MCWTCKCQALCVLYGVQIPEEQRNRVGLEGDLPVYQVLTLTQGKVMEAHVRGTSVSGSSTLAEQVQIRAQAVIGVQHPVTVQDRCNSFTRPFIHSKSMRGFL
jgi:hypothetical protein